MLQVWEAHFEDQQPWGGGGKIKVRRKQRVPVKTAE